jgi:hypothetical protein
MAKVITNIQLADDSVYSHEGDTPLYDNGDEYVRALTPQEIVDDLVQIDEDDLDDVMKGLKEHYDKLVGTQ